MSYFYGTLQGTKGEATRCGTKSTGLNTIAASYNGAVIVKLRHDTNTGKDMFSVYQIPWDGSGVHLLLAKGILGGDTAISKEIE